MKRVLLTSIGFSPNVGGIETHFDDLTKALVKRGWEVEVLTFMPLTTNVPAAMNETKAGVSIFRIPWFRGLFYKLVKNPVLEFLYLTPPLFVVLPFYLMFKGNKIDVIHSHGLIAGFVSVLWGKPFGIRVIVTTHSIYNFPQSGFYRNFAKWIFQNSDQVLCLSKQSAKEITDLGIEKGKVKVFTYWVDLGLFKPIPGAKLQLGWKAKLNVLFVGRLVKEKGVIPMLEAARLWGREINLYVAGVGPLESLVNTYAKKYENIKYLGRVDQSKLPTFYSAADLVLVPSVHEEGFGRVILEALACGTPVIAANRGAIPDVMDNSVGLLIPISPMEIKRAVEYYFRDKNRLVKLAQKTRDFATTQYSSKNVEQITSSYGPNVAPSQQ